MDKPDEPFLLLRAKANETGPRISPDGRFVAYQSDASGRCVKQVVAALQRLRALDWNGLYRHTGFKWEAIRHVRTPDGSSACSLRLSERVRAIAYRDGDFLRLISLHPDHESAYGG